MNLFRAALVGLLLTAAARAETVAVAVAISLKDAMAEIATAYEKETGDAVRFTFGSSGQLMAQIRNGAPVDAFISAADRQVDVLIETKQLDKATRRAVAGNRLVLVVPADAAAAADAPASFADLADRKYRRVAVGEPATVPAGQYAAQVLEKLGVAEALGGRLVYGANVRQVLGYVVRGEVAAGIVYATDARQAGDAKVRIVATADAETHDPIVYPAAVVTASRRREAAARFLDFLGGKTARKVLADRGFTDPAADAKEAKPADAPGSDTPDASDAADDADACDTPDDADASAVREANGPRDPAAEAPAQPAHRGPAGR